MTVDVDAGQLHFTGGNLHTGHGRGGGLHPHAGLGFPQTLHGPAAKPSSVCCFICARRPKIYPVITDTTAIKTNADSVYENPLEFFIPNI